MSEPTNPNETVNPGAEELDQEQLDQAAGGVLTGMLLPAVQKVRDPPSRSKASDPDSPPQYVEQE